jgi:tight adherence protein B
MMVALMGLQVAVLAWAVVAASSSRSARRTHTRARLMPPDRRTRAAAPTCAAWAELLDHVAAEVRAGRSLAAALDHAVHLTGAPTPQPAQPPAQPADSDEAVVVASLAMAGAIGGPVAATLQQGASVLRERVALRAEAAVHAAQSRLSARVLTLLPIVVAALGTCTSQSFRAALGSVAGTACAAVGLAVNGIGWRWMRREIARVTA